MEKLERVLVAEDDARSALADAHGACAKIRAAANEDARRIETEAAEASRSAVAAHRVEVLATAGEMAERITRESTAAGERTLTEARAHLDDTVRRIAASLEG